VLSFFRQNLKLRMDWLVIKFVFLSFFIANGEMKSMCGKTKLSDLFCSFVLFMFTFFTYFYSTTFYQTWFTIFKVTIFFPLIFIKLLSFSIYYLYFITSLNVYSVFLCFQYLSLFSLALNKTFCCDAESIGKL
jgi:hypothetical protein